METNLILVDTNIIIEVLRNNKDIIEVIKSTGIERMAVSSIYGNGTLLWGVK
jgi:predicted nucleic acid-binding protein